MRFSFRTILPSSAYMLLVFALVCRLVMLHRCDRVLSKVRKSLPLHRESQAKSDLISHQSRLACSLHLTVT